MNYGIKHATGKYFKLLDGDDWIDTEALDNLIQELKVIDTDVVVFPYKKGTDRNNMVVRAFSDVFGNEEYFIKDHKIDRAIAMWSLCYKTALLKDSNLELPSHTLYTDQYYAMYPFAKAKTIRYYDFPVYLYRLGRDGQSVSKESRIKNIDIIIKICKKMVEFLVTQKYNPNYHYMFYRTMVTYRNTIKTFMLLPITQENIDQLRYFDNHIKLLSPDLYDSFMKQRKIGKFIGLCRRTNYRIYPLIKLVFPKGFPNF